jgi:hypothetical protein
VTKNQQVVDNTLVLVVDILGFEVGSLHRILSVVVGGDIRAVVGDIQAVVEDIRAVVEDIRAVVGDIGQVVVDNLCEGVEHWVEHSHAVGDFVHLGCRVVAVPSVDINNSEVCGIKIIVVHLI